MNAGASIHVAAVERRPDRDESWLVRELADRYYLWDAYVGGERRVDLHPLVLGRALHEAAVRAAEDVARVVFNTAHGALEDRSEREHYALSSDVIRLALASHRAGDGASLVRVDLLLDEQLVWRVCEINADCPGGHNEALALPRLARRAGFLGGTNPTVLLDAMCDRLAAMASLAERPASVEPAVAIVYATAYAEDLQVCALVQRVLRERGVRAVLVPPTAPRMVGSSLHAGGVPVQALYRFFPTELMDGQHNLDGLVSAVESRRAVTLSSFSQMFAQSKMALARVWTHASTMSAASRAIVQRHLPTTLDLNALSADELVRERRRWVVKRSLGRVGEEVFVGRLIPVSEWEKLVAHVRRLAAAGEAWIAQEFVPQARIATPWGDRLLTLGVYLLDGRFVGYFARVTSESHVSHDALCLPVFWDANRAHPAGRAKGAA